MKTFTSQQVLMYLAYEKVRAAGRYNMFDPRARLATGLTKEQYGFVMDNFDKLREAAKGTP